MKELAHMTEILGKDVPTETTQFENIRTSLLDASQIMGVVAKSVSVVIQGENESE